MSAVFYDWEQEEDPHDPILDSMKKQAELWLNAVENRRASLRHLLERY